MSHYQVGELKGFIWRLETYRHLLVLERQLETGKELKLFLVLFAHLVQHNLELVAAAVLVQRGASVDEAVAVVAASRPLAGPEAGAQVQLLHALADQG